MSFSPISASYPFVAAGEAENVSKSPVANMNATQAIDRHFIQQAKDKLPSNASDADIGIQAMKDAVSIESQDDYSIPALIDSIRKGIEEERNKANPNWTTVDTLLRQLTAIILKKAGFDEIQISQEEVERQRKAIEDLRKTYNSPWTLAAQIGTGLLSIVGGVLGISGGVAGFAELVKGASKVSGTVTHLREIGTSIGTVAQGISPALVTPLTSNSESHRAEANARNEHHRNQREAAKAAEQQANNTLSGIVRGIQAKEDAEASAASSLYR